MDELFEAAKTGDVAAATEALDGGADVDVRDEVRRGRAQRGASRADLGRALRGARRRRALLRSLRAWRAAPAKLRVALARGPAAARTLMP